MNSFTEKYNRLSLKAKLDSLSLIEENKLSQYYNLLVRDFNSILDYAVENGYFKKSFDLLMKFANIAIEKKQFSRAHKFALRTLKIAKSRNEIESFAVSWQLIGMVFFKNNENKKAIKPFKKALFYYEKSNNKQELGKVLLFIGINCRKLNSYKQGLDYLNKALEIEKSVKNNKQLAVIYNELGLIEFEMGFYQKATKYFIQARKIMESLQDSDLFPVISNIGNIYYVLKNYKKALKYYFDALETNNLGKSNKAYILNNIGCIYLEEKKFYQANNYLNKSIQYKKELNDNKGLSQTYQNLATVYIEQDRYEEAIKYCQKSIEIKEKIGFSKALINSLNTIAYLYLNTHRLEEAYSILIRNEKLVNTYNEKRYLPKLYKNFTTYYQLKDKPGKALGFYKKYAKVKEELLQKKNSKEIQKLQMRYEHEKKIKEAEIYRLKNIELKKANAAKDKFFSIVAHDLKSPFSVFQSFIKLFKQYYDKYSKDEMHTFISELENNVNNTYKLLENLLNWSRLQSGVLIYRPEKFDLFEKANQVVELKLNAAQQKDIKLINKISPNLLVYADPFMIRTVLRNLISNAIKFTEKEGLITIKSEILEDKVKVMVEDTGVGMTNEQKEKLFKIETSFSTFGTKEEKGTGLGLILCVDLIKKNKGSISVESQVNKGSIFSFNLPKNN